MNETGTCEWEGCAEHARAVRIDIPGGCFIAAVLCEDCEAVQRALVED